MANSTWEYELGERSADGIRTEVLFRAFGFEDGYSEFDLARRAQTRALILERLSSSVATGSAQPYFPASAD